MGGKLPAIAIAIAIVEAFGGADPQQVTRCRNELSGSGRLFTTALTMEVNGCVILFHLIDTAPLFLLEMSDGHWLMDPAFHELRLWNEGRVLGAKRALKPQQVWAIRFWLTSIGGSETERFLTLR